MNFLFIALLGGLVCFSMSYYSLNRQPLQRNIIARPIYYHWYCACWCFIPAMLVLLIWYWAEIPILKYLIMHHLPTTVGTGEVELLVNRIMLAAQGIIAPDSSIANVVTHYQHIEQISETALMVVFLLILISGGSWALSRLGHRFNAQRKIEKLIQSCLLLCSVIAILTTLGIVFSVLSESILFFQSVSVFEFFLGTEWSPQTALRADQVGSSGAFGAIPLFTGTLMITGIVLFVAGPIGIMTALYLSEIAEQKTRTVVKPLLEILAGIPTVVYGFFAVLTVAPLIRDWSALVGIQASSESALAAGLTMGIMIIPFVSSLSDDVIHAVPQSLRDGSYALGATESETIFQVVFPAALPGIVGSFLLAISRAIGETMIVLMAAGLAANLTANPFEAVTTVTVQIVNLIQGDQEFDSPKTLAAFALGLTLFFTTLLLNVVALKIVRRYREKYE